MLPMDSQSSSRWLGPGPTVDLEVDRVWVCRYATFFHRSGNEQLEGSPPQRRT